MHLQIPIHLYIYIYIHQLRPPREQNNDKMGNPKKSKAELKCKKHPKHQQSPGVCSLCLTERLSQILSRRSSTATAGGSSSCCSSSPSSLSSIYSSSSASSCSSPLGKSSTTSISFLFNGKNVLTKSRSVACVPRMKNGDYNDNKNKKKGRGFWSRLLRPRSKGIMEETLMHSRTVRERMIIT